MTAAPPMSLPSTAPFKMMLETLCSAWNIWTAGKSDNVGMDLD